MGKIKIAIIDSGVNHKHPAFFNHQPVLSYDITQTSGSDEYGHGTAIYHIIRKVEDIADIMNFKLEQVENGVGEDELINMLKKIRNEYHFDIINLSLGMGICENISELQAICTDLTDSGSIIVSAFDNTGSISFPAAFDNVIGVTAGKGCARINDFEYIQDTVVNLGAKGDIQRIAWNNPEYIMLGGNSFACAHVTVQVAKFLTKGIKGLEDILKEFKGIAKSQYLAEESYTLNNANEGLPFTMKKAALFPFNKEMHSLIRFSKELDFEIVGVYDSKYSANVGSTTSHIMKADVTCLPIQNIAKIQWEDFDTLILGHMDEMSNLINKQELKTNLIYLAKKYKKNVYAFDDVSSISNAHHIFSPKIDKTDLPPNRFGKLYRYAKPIIGVYGTSSRQGKFTLQLELRKNFQHLGYKVGQIGTEPSALLYGMDYVYPMGYNNSVYIKEYESIRYLNHMVQNLCVKDIDIIITGSQSGVIPFDFGNLAQYSLPQINYLLGTQPDVVILCINPFDELDYIMRTKMFIEASVDCKVIGFVMFPMDLKDNWTGIYGQRVELSNEKYKKLTEVIRKETLLPVFKLGEEGDMSLIVEKIIHYFSEGE